MKQGIQEPFKPSAAMSLKPGDHAFSCYPDAIRVLLDKAAGTAAPDMQIVKDLHKEWRAWDKELREVNRAFQSTQLPGFIIYGMFWFSRHYLGVVQEVLGRSGTLKKWQSEDVKFPNVMYDDVFRMLCLYIEDPSVEICSCCDNRVLSMSTGFAFLSIAERYGVTCSCCGEPIVDSVSLYNAIDAGSVWDPRSEKDVNNTEISLYVRIENEARSIHAVKTMTYDEVVKIAEAQEKGERLSEADYDYILSRYRFRATGATCDGGTSKGILVYKFHHRSCHIQHLSRNFTEKLSKAVGKSHRFFDNYRFVDNEYGSEAYAGKWLQFSSYYGDITAGWRKRVIEIRYPDVKGKKYLPDTKETHDYGLEHVNNYEEAAAAIKKFAVFADGVLKEAKEAFDFSKY